jgi:hypothetical protein
LRDVTDRIHAAGTELVVLGNGTPQQARWFAEDVGLSTPVLTDPGLHAYQAVGARRGLRAVLHPAVFVRALQARRKGHRQSVLKGDATQLGGVFVVRPGPKVIFAYRSRYAGDLPEVEEVLAALDRTR